tara:strand:+ start:127 stop:420 length:294 start_codon:yes stop_codon:yes gene_type:complete
MEDLREYNFNRSRVNYMDYVKYFNLVTVCPYGDEYKIFIDKFEDSDENMNLFDELHKTVNRATIFKYILRSINKILNKMTREEVLSISVEDLFRKVK